MSERQILAELGLLSPVDSALRQQLSQTDHTLPVSLAFPLYKRTNFIKTLLKLRNVQSVMRNWNGTHIDSSHV